MSRYLKAFNIPERNISESMTGKKLSPEHRAKVIKTLNHGRGDKNPYWKGGERINEWGYRYILMDGKYVLEHRYVMEKHLNRKLTLQEEVHHLDGNKLNNDISNLVVLSKSDHSKLHWSKPGKKEAHSANMREKYDKGEILRFQTRKPRKLPE